MFRCIWCLKKQYCSQACLLQDYAKGHTREKFCKSEGEEWKVRGSKTERVEKERQKTQQYLAGLAEDNMMGDNVKEMVKTFQDQL